MRRFDRTMMPSALDISLRGAVTTLILIAACDGDHDPCGSPDARAEHRCGLSDAGSPTVAPDGGGLSQEAGLGGKPAGSDPQRADGGSSADASSGTSGAIPATFATVKLVMGGGGGIMPCAAAPCHGVNGIAPPDHPLELPQGDDHKLYTALTTYVSKACGNTKLVTPGDETKSALVRILQGPCGATPRMPYGCSAEAGDCIPDDYIAAVAKWIAAGAPR